MAVAMFVPFKLLADKSAELSRRTIHSIRKWDGGWAKAVTPDVRPGTTYRNLMGRIILPRSYSARGMSATLDIRSLRGWDSVAL
jgi:hypothetical protein